MVAVPDIRKRCLIWLGRPTPREREVLAAAGWELRVVDDPASARIGLRGSDLVAGLVDLRGAAPAWRAAMHELLARHPELPLASLGDEHDDELPGECLLSLREPLDLDQVRGLQRIAEGEGAPSACGPDGDCLVGRSPALLQVRASLNKFAPVELPVLVTGETGTGKELAAECVHDLSPRAKGAFVVVDCGAIPPTLIESELFGHERGAFTGATASYAGAFERAHGGTVFLDELGELPLAMQPKLLRVLEAKEVRRVGGQKTINVDLRIVAATNRDLGVEVNRGRFREDLFYRLAVARIVVPPLRERTEDIPLLIEGILATTPGGEGAYIAAETIDLMMKHDWPGNVRELRNVIERAVLLAEPPENAAQLRRSPAPQPPPRTDHTPSTTASSPDATMTVPVDIATPFKAAKGNVVAEFERRYISKLLAHHDGNISAAARAAGIDRMSIHKMLHRLGLANPGRDDGPPTFDISDATED